MKIDVDADYYAPDRKKKKAKQIAVGITVSLPANFRFRKGLEGVREFLGSEQFKIKKAWRKEGTSPYYFLNGEQLGLEDQQKIDQFLHLINFCYVPNRVLPVDVSVRNIKPCATCWFVDLVVGPENIRRLFPRFATPLRQ
jgi:hypothetical protein